MTKAMKSVNAALTTVSLAFLAAMVAIVCLNVLFRYVIGSALTWASEVARYCMVWSAFTASVVLVNNGQHLAVDMLFQFAPARFSRWIRTIIDIVNAIFFLLLAGIGFRFVLRTTNQIASSVPIPMNIVYLIIPVTFALMGVGSGIRAVCSARNSGEGNVVQ